MLFSVSLTNPRIDFGIVVVDGYVTKAVPSQQWMEGKTLSYVECVVRMNGGQVKYIDPQVLSL